MKWSLSLIGVAGRSQPSKRLIHWQSPHRMWTSVPWIECQNAPRSCAPLGLAQAVGGVVEPAVHLGVVGGHRADIGGVIIGCLLYCAVQHNVLFAVSRAARQT